MMGDLKTLLKKVFALDINQDITLSALTYDSRKIAPNSLFCAYPGFSSDGRHHLPQAIANGAKAILVEAACSESEPQYQQAVPIYAVTNLSKHLSELAAVFYQHPSQSVKVIGITGTNGKTSCSHLLASALNALGERCGVLGSLGNGFLGQLDQTANTTVHAFDVQAYLAKMRDQGASYCAMEVSSHALDQGRINAVQFALVALTNLTQDHLDYHGSLAEYAEAKLKLFQRAVPAIVNGDDALGQRIQAAAVAPVVACGLQSRPQGNFVWAKAPKLSFKGIEAEFDSSWGAGTLVSQLLGEFNVMNLLMVLAMLLQFDFRMPAILDVMQTLKPIPGRLECFAGDEQPLVVVDFAHTPDALQQVLTTLKPLCQGQLFCVFGCGGERDRGKRAQMAHIAESHANTVIITQDNSRKESPQQIFDDMISGLQSPQSVLIEPDRKKAIAHAWQLATMGDVIVVAGKGRECYQDIDGVKHPYSDIDEVKLLVRG